MKTKNIIYTLLLTLSVFIFTPHQTRAEVYDINVSIPFFIAKEDVIAFAKGLALRKFGFTFTSHPDETIYANIKKELELVNESDNSVITNGSNIKVGNVISVRNLGTSGTWSVFGKTAQFGNNIYKSRKHSFHPATNFYSLVSAGAFLDEDKGEMFLQSSNPEIVQCVNNRCTVLKEGAATISLGITGDTIDPTLSKTFTTRVEPSMVYAHGDNDFNLCTKTKCTSRTKCTCTQYTNFNPLENRIVTNKYTPYLYGQTEGIGRIDFVGFKRNTGRLASMEDEDSNMKSVLYGFGIKVFNLTFGNPVDSVSCSGVDISGNSATIRWNYLNTLLPQQGYTVEVYTNSGFSGTPAFSEINVSPTVGAVRSVTFNGLVENTNYYSRIKVYNTGWSAWVSNCGSFTVGEPNSLSVSCSVSETDFTLKTGETTRFSASSQNASGTVSYAWSRIGENYSGSSFTFNATGRSNGTYTYTVVGEDNNVSDSAVCSVNVNDTGTIVTGTSTPPIVPTLSSFKFSPNIANSISGKCSYELIVDNVTSCSLTNRIGTPVNIFASLNKINTSGDLPIGSYILKCIGLDGVTETTVLARNSCYSNSDIKEN